MQVLFALYVFSIAACIGSFLNVVIYRVPLGRSIVAPASACGSCGEPLLWWMNIPILGYLYNRGRCQYCGSSYSARYAWIELFFAVVTTWLWWTFQPDWVFCLTATVFLAVGVCVFWIDVDHWIIPDGVNLFGVLSGLLFALIRSDFEPMVAWMASPQLNTFIDGLLAACIACAAFYGLSKLGKVLARQDALGLGDVKYAAVLGAYLGLKYVGLGCLLSFLLGGVYAVPVLLLRLRGGKQAVPFGTFMSVGGFLALVYGQELLSAWIRWVGY